MILSCMTFPPFWYRLQVCISCNFPSLSFAPSFDCYNSRTSVFLVLRLCNLYSCSFLPLGLQKYGCKLCIKSCWFSLTFQGQPQAYLWHDMTCMFMITTVIDHTSKAHNIPWENERWASHFSFHNDRLLRPHRHWGIPCCLEIGYSRSFGRQW